jgi:hypothetical protein
MVALTSDFLHGKKTDSLTSKKIVPGLSPSLSELERSRWPKNDRLTAGTFLQAFLPPGWPLPLTWSPSAPRTCSRSRAPGSRLTRVSMPLVGTLTSPAAVALVDLAVGAMPLPNMRLSTGFLVPSTPSSLTWAFHAAMAVRPPQLRDDLIE